MSAAHVLNADCLAALRDMPDASVDAIVTDPPYGLSNTTPATRRDEPPKERTVNEKKKPADQVWADGNGDEFWAHAVPTVPPTRSAAYVGAALSGVFLTAAQCRQVAAHLTALADAHEEADQ